MSYWISIANSCYVVTYVCIERRRDFETWFPQWSSVMTGNLHTFSQSLCLSHTHTHANAHTHIHSFLHFETMIIEVTGMFFQPIFILTTWESLEINRSFCRGLYSFYVSIKQALSIKLQIKNKHLLRILDVRDFPFLLFLLCWIFVLEIFYLDYSQLNFWKGLPGGSDSEESVCNVGDLGLISGLGRSPGREHGSPFQYSCLENPHGQRSLIGYSLWDLKESDTTEQLSISICFWKTCIVEMIKKESGPFKVYTYIYVCIYILCVCVCMCVSRKSL